MSEQYLLHSAAELVRLHNASPGYGDRGDRQRALLELGQESPAHEWEGSQRDTYAECGQHANRPGPGQNDVQTRVGIEHDLAKLLHRVARGWQPPLTLDVPDAS